MRRFQMSNEDKFEKKYEENDYYCGFCKYKFTQNIRTSIPQNIDGKHNRVTTQVVCPRCNNFLKSR